MRPHAVEVPHPALLMRNSNLEQPLSAHNSVPPPELLHQLYNPVRVPYAQFTDNRQSQQYQSRAFAPNSALNDFSGPVGLDQRTGGVRQDPQALGLHHGQQHFGRPPPGAPFEYGFRAPNLPLSAGQPQARPFRGTPSLGSAQQEMLATLFSGSRPNA